MRAEVNELRTILTRAILIINNMSDEIELIEQQKDDFATIAQRLKAFEQINDGFHKDVLRLKKQADHNADIAATYKIQNEP